MNRPVSFSLKIAAILSLLTLTLTAASTTIQSPRSTQPRVVSVMLSRHYGFPSGLCRLAISAWEGDGSISLRCGLSPDTIGAAHDGRPPERSRQLTGKESAELRRLCSSARLFDGGYIGADLTASDSVFEILKFTDGRTAVLVTSGNPTFASGPRKALLDWLRREEEALRKNRPAPG
jgi:hypothetical protein